VTGVQTCALPIFALKLLGYSLAAYVIGRRFGGLRASPFSVGTVRAIIGWLGGGAGVVWFYALDIPMIPVLGAFFGGRLPFMC
jgi:hypothetical protein